MTDREKRGRKPLGDQPMTDAERASRYRRRQRLYAEIGGRVYERIILENLHGNEAGAVLDKIQAELAHKIAYIAK